MTQSSRSDRFWGSIIYALMWLLGQLPAWWHYFWADVIALVTQYLLRYRVKEVEEHLTLSFPHLSKKEHAHLKREVYRHLGDLVVEYFMLAGFSKKRLQKHIQCEAAEVMTELHNKGHKNIFYLLGHYGNWEWFTGFQAMLPMTQFYVLYKKQHGPMDFVLTKLRTKFGGKLIEKNMSARSILALKNDPEPKTFIFVADQTPAFPSIYLYVDFLGRETAVFTGMEVLAQKLQCPVVYIDVWREKRGKYFAKAVVMTEDASSLPEGQLSADFMKRLETTILRRPQHWLWTHRRWKHHRQNVEASYPDRKVLKL